MSISRSLIRRSTCVAEPGSLKAGLHVLVLISASALFIYGGWQVYWSIESSSWPTAMASLQRVEHDAGTSGPGRTGVSESMRMDYSYVVDKQEHSGSRVAYGFLRFVDDGQVKEMMTAYFNGEGYPVHYAPGNPSRSVMFPGFNFGGVILVILAMILSVVGGAWLWQVRKQ